MYSTVISLLIINCDDELCIIMISLERRQIRPSHSPCPPGIFFFLFSLFSPPSSSLSLSVVHLHARYHPTDHHQNTSLCCGLSFFARFPSSFVAYQNPPVVVWAPKFTIRPVLFDTGFALNLSPFSPAS